MENKNKKELNFIFEKGDFIKDSKTYIDKKSFENLVKSFENYLLLIDENTITDKDKQGNDWNIDKLLKEEKRLIRICKDVISGDCCSVNDKGEMSSFDSTQKIIFRLIKTINIIILIRKKIKELKENGKNN